MKKGLLVFAFLSALTWSSFATDPMSPVSLGLDFGDILISQIHDNTNLRLSADWFLDKNLTFVSELFFSIPDYNYSDSFMSFNLGIDFFFLSREMLFDVQEPWGMYVKALVVQDIWQKSSYAKATYPGYNIGLQVNLGYKFYLKDIPLYFAPEFGYTGRFLGWGSTYRLGIFAGVKF